MDKQRESNLTISTESFNVGVKDFKRVTGSFNAGLKDLKEMASKQVAKQNQSKDTKSARG